VSRQRPERDNQRSARRFPKAQQRNRSITKPVVFANHSMASLLDRLPHFGGPGREPQGLRTQESGRNRVVVPQKAKQFQFALMGVDFQNGQERHQHDRGIDKRR